MPLELDNIKIGCIKMETNPCKSVMQEEYNCSCIKYVFTDTKEQQRYIAEISLGSAFVFKKKV